MNHNQISNSTKLSINGKHFTVRIVLRNIRTEDTNDNRIYKVLHEKMKDLFFEKTVTELDITYELPDAEYFFQANSDCEDIADYTTNAIVNLFNEFTHYQPKIEDHYSILVTGDGTYAIRHLEEVKKKDDQS